MELLMIYKISPCLPAPVPTEGGAGRLTPLCLSMTGKGFPKRRKERAEMSQRFPAIE